MSLTRCVVEPKLLYLFSQLRYYFVILDSQDAVGVGRPASLNDQADLLAEVAAVLKFQRCFTASRPQLTGQCAYSDQVANTDSERHDSRYTWLFSPAVDARMSITRSLAQGERCRPIQPRWEPRHPPQCAIQPRESKCRGSLESRHNSL